MDLGLTGRVAIVTGGSRGIGRAIAQVLASEGVDVAICARQRQALDEAAKALSQETGRRIIPIVADTMSSESVAHLVDATVRAFGRVDVLVNNASTPGGMVRGPLAEADDKTLLEDIDTKVVGYMRCAKAVAPHMRQRRWGRIINIGSTAAEVGFARHSAYCASKHGLLGLTRCVALEGAAHGVTCNAINPGTVATGLTRIGSGFRVKQGGQGRDIEENLRMIAERYPQKRLIDAEEIAALSLFLCREEARGLTGEALTVSGGAPW